MIAIDKMFTQEELALMSLYKSESMRDLLTALQTALPHLTDKLAADTTADCIYKLCPMEEKDFPVLQAAMTACELF